VPWLVELLRPALPPPAPAPRIGSRSTGRTRSTGDESVADWFTEAHRWADVLVGWHVVKNGGDGEADGSRWRHPTAASPWSATIRHGCLFNYSPNSGLPVTEPGHAEGLTKFRAFAILEHGGDLSAAARAARGLLRRTSAA
jgi:hypothetical protein